MAGASMKDIKLRIKSVESTMQITKAMQLVATSKLRRAKERMEASKPYGQISGAAMAAAVARCTDPNVPFVTPRSVKRRCYVVIAGERGLAGGYNNNIFKAVAIWARSFSATSTRAWKAFPWVPAMRWPSGSSKATPARNSTRSGWRTPPSSP